MNPLRAYIRNILKEVADENFGFDMFQDNIETPEMIETNKLSAFLDSEGIFGMESDLISILEKNPTDKVQSDLESYMTFKQIDKPIEQMTIEEMLDLYLSLNNMSHYKQQILSYVQ